MKTGYEFGDLSIDRVLIWFGGLAVAVAIASVVAQVVLFKFSARSGMPAITKDRPAFPDLDTSTPRLQIDPRGELRRMWESQGEQLATYGWVDRPKGIVRIPIDKAMELLLNRGLPAEKPR